MKRLFVLIAVFSISVNANTMPTHGKLYTAFCETIPSSSICLQVPLDTDEDSVADAVDQCLGAADVNVDGSGCETVAGVDPGAGVLPMIEAIVAAAPAQHATEARFAKIPGSEIDVLVQCGEFSFGADIQCNNSHIAFMDWTSGAWNFSDWEFCLGAGGGHNDYGGNELYCANLVTNGGLSIDWTRAIDPAPLVGGHCGHPESGPVATHTYGTPLYIDSRKEYFHIARSSVYSTLEKCLPATEEKRLTTGIWTTDKTNWTKRQDWPTGSYLQAAYHRNADKIIVWGYGYWKRWILDPAQNYETFWSDDPISYLNNGKPFDVAMDQSRDIFYWYADQLGIFGIHYDPQTMVGTNVFRSSDKILDMQSLSVEHSTGNLVIVGLRGKVIHVDVTTGRSEDISDRVTGGIPTIAGPQLLVQKHIMNKFSLIEPIPCVGIGVSDPRDGIYLMTLPASICRIELYGVGKLQPVPFVLPQNPKSTAFNRASDPVTDRWPLSRYTYISPILDAQLLSSHKSL